MKRSMDLTKLHTTITNAHLLGLVRGQPKKDLLPLTPLKRSTLDYRMDRLRAGGYIEQSGYGRYRRTPAGDAVVKEGVFPEALPTTKEARKIIMGGIPENSPHTERSNERGDSRQDGGSFDRTSQPLLSTDESIVSWEETQESEEKNVGREGLGTLLRDPWRIFGHWSSVSPKVPPPELALEQHLSLKPARFTPKNSKDAETVRRLREIERARALRSDSQSEPPASPDG